MSGAASVLNGNGAMVLGSAAQTALGSEVFEADQSAEDQGAPVAQGPAFVVARAAEHYS